MSDEADFEAEFQVAGDIVLARVRAVTDRLESHILPIYRIAEDGDMGLEGSAVLVRLGLRYFVATAAHVLRSCPNGFAIPTQAGILQQPYGSPVVSRPLVARSRKFTPPDLGVVELTDAEAAEYGDARFWDLDRVSSAPLRVGPTVFLAIGYPERDGVWDARKERFQAQITMFMSGPEEDRAYQLSGTDMRSHVLIRYRREAIQSKRSVGAPPSFRGMSGCGVWPLDVLNDPGQNNPPCLCGILIERPQGFGASFLVTRATILRGFIERFVSPE